MSSIEPFKVMEVLRRAIELSSDGADIVHMAVGEPDFPTPDKIIFPLALKNKLRILL